MTESVDYELAQLLTKKEYKSQERLGKYVIKNTRYYKEKELFYPAKELDETGCENHCVPENRMIDAPTIADVLMWLYEKHGIWINIDRFHNCFNIVHIKKYDEFEDSNNLLELEGLDFADFLTPTEAYEAAIEYTLNNLI